VTPRLLRGAAAALALVAGLAPVAAGQEAEGGGAVAPPSTASAHATLSPAVPMRAGVSPVVPSPHLGDPLIYRGWVVVSPTVGVRWSAPDRGGDLVWGPVRTGRVPMRRPLGSGAPWPADSVWVEAPLSVFALGTVSVPGLGFRLEGGQGVLRAGRLPVVRVRVVPVLAAGDSNASLRPPRGPLAAPWWERVAWGVVLVAAAAIVAALWLIRRLRRRKPVAPAAVPATAARRRDPGAEALADLASLRRRELPAAGRFAEHAFLLGRILRRYLEATVNVPRPGDTTPELIRHLQSGGFSAEDLQRLTSLLRRWDAIKFARLESDVQEAERCEEAVRDLVVRRSRPPKQEVA